MKYFLSLTLVCFLVTSISCTGDKNEEEKEKVSADTESESLKREKSKETNIKIKKESPNFIKDNCNYVQNSNDIKCNTIEGQRVVKVVGWEVPNLETNRSEEVDLKDIEYEISVAKVTAGLRPEGTVAIYLSISKANKLPKFKNAELRNNPRNRGVVVKSEFEREFIRTEGEVEIKASILLNDKTKYVLEKRNPKIVLSSRDDVPRVALNIKRTSLKQLNYLISNENITEEIRK